jgi:hypothetical protein
VTVVAAVFYYRNGCHLCEELASLLHRGWPDVAQSMDWRDVDTRPEWRRLHGGSVPVLMLAEHVVCALRPDIDRISDYFGPMSNPL